METDFVNIGAMGIIAMTFTLTIKWITGKLTETIESNTKAVRMFTLTQMEMYKLLLAHDAEVRGINPGAGKTEKERQGRAQRTYMRLLNSVDQLIETIKSNPLTINLKT